MMSNRDNGVAPVWAATGDGAYSIPAGFKCIGFYVETAGNVSFTSGGTATGDIAVPQGTQPAMIESFQAPSTGPATGVWALLIK